MMVVWVRGAEDDWYCDCCLQNIITRVQANLIGNPASSRLDTVDDFEALWIPSDIQVIVSSLSIPYKFGMFHTVVFD